MLLKNGTPKFCSILMDSHNLHPWITEKWVILYQSKAHFSRIQIRCYMHSFSEWSLLVSRAMLACLILMSTERAKETPNLLENRIFQLEDKIPSQQINAGWNHDVLGFHLTLMIEIGRLYQMSLSPIPLSRELWRALPFIRMTPWLYV